MIKLVGDHLWPRETICGGISCLGGPSMVAATGPGDWFLGDQLWCDRINSWWLRWCLHPSTSMMTFNSVMPASSPRQMDVAFVYLALVQVPEVSSFTTGISLGVSQFSTQDRDTLIDQSVNTRRLPSTTLINLVCVVAWTTTMTLNNRAITTQLTLFRV